MIKHKYINQNIYTYIYSIMKSLTANVILQCLDRDRQTELYKLLEKELHKDTSLKNIYIVEYYYSCPTGGAICDHDRPLLITGSYTEAKEFFDNITKEFNKILTNDDWNHLTEVYTLLLGSDIIEEVYVNYSNLTITKKNNTNNEISIYEDYILKYPLYDVRICHGYDTKTSLGIYDSLENATKVYTDQINKHSLTNDDYEIHYGEKIMVLRINKDSKFDEWYGGKNSTVPIIMKAKKYPQ